MSAGAVIVGNAAGRTVIVLVTGASVLPHASFAVNVSVTVPPHAPGVAVSVEVLDVPLISHPPVKPLLKDIVLGAGNPPQSTVMSLGAVIVGNAAGRTVIVLVTGASSLPQASVAVNVSVTVPPHAPGVSENVDGLDVPLISQPPVNPLLNVTVLEAGNPPQSTVMSLGAVIVGNAAGRTVIVLVTGASSLPQASVAVNVSVTVPPHAPGVAEKVDGLDFPLIAQPPVNPLLKFIVVDSGNPPQSTVMAAGAVIVGNAAGRTVIVLVTGASSLPQASVAVNVSVTVPPHAPGVAEKVDGLDFPLIAQPPVNPLLKFTVVDSGTPPQSTVMSAGAVIVGNAAGRTVIVLVTGASSLPHASVAVNVSVTVPPHAPGVAEKVDGLDFPLIAQPPVNPLLKFTVVDSGTPPQSTVMSAGAVIVGNAAGRTVIVLVTGASSLPQASVAVNVSVTVPPHAPGVAEKVDGLDFPLIAQPPVNPLLKFTVVDSGTPPQSTVMSAGAVIVGNAAGRTVIVLVTGASSFPQASVAVNVSVTVPPHAPGVAENVDGLDFPLIAQPPVNSLLKFIVVDSGNPPQSTVMAAGAVIVGNAAGRTVIVLDTEAIVLPHASFAVNVSVTSPPHASGVLENVEGLDVPLISQLPVNPLLKGIVLGAGSPPQSTVMSSGAVIVGNAAGRTVMVLDTEATVLPHASFAVNVSVTSPPHASGVLENVEGLDVPLISHPPVKPLLKGIVLGAGTPPQSTVMSSGAVIVGNAAGRTVIVLDTEAIVLPHASFAVNVSVTSPPHASGVLENVEGLDVPLISQLPVNPLLNAIVLGAGSPPQSTVMSSGAVIVGNAAGRTVMVLDTEAIVLPHASFAVNVSVTVPPHAPGVAVNVEGLDVPLISHPPVKPLLKGIVLGAGTPPQSTVMSAGAVIVGNAAGRTVIVLDTEASVLPHASFAVNVSVTVPPHAPGVAVSVEVLDVPLISHPPVKSLLKGIVLGAGTPPQSTVMSAGAVIVGNAAGRTVMVLDTEAIVLPHASFAVNVSVTSPPHASGVLENVEGLDVPLISHPPVKPLLKGIVLGAGTPPQSTVMSAGAVIVGNAAGRTVIVLDTGASVLPHAVAVKVSVTSPPHAPGDVENVDKLDVPLIAQPPVSPLLNGILLGAGTPPQSTVMLAGGALKVGNAAGLTVILRVFVIVLP
ncbi:MAG: hypothetical protein WKG06_19040 [Segetibacter sp.]